MPFTKESAKEYGKKGGETPSGKTKAWDNIVGWLVGDGGVAFKNKLEALSVGGEITKEEKEFLEHYKDLLEFHQPKLTRADNKTELSGKINVSTIKYSE